MPTSQPLVSVLIPAYNHASYVQETLRSIINQTYPHIELIVVDDGSTDDTWQRIKAMQAECEKRFVRVHFETKENEGTCRTLNRLLSHAQGEYIYLIASDDMAKPQAIAKEEAFLTAHPDYVLCVGDNDLIDSDGKICYWDAKRDLVYDEQQAVYHTFVEFLSHGRGTLFASESFGTYATLYRGNYIPNGYLIRKSTLDKIPPFTTQAPLEDYYLMLQLSKQGKMKYSNEILFSYRQHGSQTMRNVAAMHRMAVQTQRHEDNLLAKLYQAGKLSAEMEQLYKKGSFCYTRGIPNVFEIEKFVKADKKIKYYKLFGKLIYTQEIPTI